MRERKPSGRRVAMKRPDGGGLTITSEAVVAAAALLVSLLSLSSSAFFALRGSVVTAVPPDSVFLYRDAGVGAGAVLTAGVDTSLVNSASGNYGDVVTRVTMEIDEPSGEDPTFRYSTLVTPVFSEDATEQAKNCPVTARCVVNDGQFLSIEEPRRTLDVPGGASRSEYIGFVLEATNCATPGGCTNFRDFETAARQLERAETLSIRFHYDLYSDGRKTAVCNLNLKPSGQATYTKWLADHLKRKGWVLLLCQR